MREVKKALRKQLIGKRRDMDRAYKERCDKDIFCKLVPLLEEADAVLTYVSTDIEVDTRAVIEYCLEKGIPVATPVSGDSELTFYEITSFDDLKEGRFGIMEPIMRDAPFVGGSSSLCVVPALCADESGLRLGYGRGYYDRYLSRFEGRSVIVCYSDFRMEVPSEPHDRRTDMTIFDSI